jgi:hypothetical protein
VTETYAPRWAPHASGTFERETDGDGLPAPTWVRLSCSKCGATHSVRCVSGAPRNQVVAWASAHLHRDAMKEEFPKGGAR